VVISGITYLYPALKNHFFPDDGIDLVALNSDGHAIIRNASDRPSFLFQLRILTRVNEQEVYEYTVQILDSIEPNSHKETEVDFRRKRLFQGDEVLQTITCGTKMADDQWNRAVALAIEDARNPRSRERQGGGCYQVHFFLQDGIYLTDLRRKSGPDLRTTRATATLLYCSGVTSSIVRKSWPLEGVVVEVTMEGCPPR
jgi:hypothetical protein